MKKIVVVLMSMLAMLVAACGGSNAEAISTDNGGKIMQSENKTNSSKALVVYYSRSGNTEALARMIGNETGADGGDHRFIFPENPLRHHGTGECVEGSGVFS